MLLFSKLVITLLCHGALTQATGTGINFYLGFYLNINSMRSNPSITIITTESQPVSYSIEIPGIGYYHNGTITANNEDTVDLPRRLSRSAVVLSRDDQDKGIYIETSSDRVTVVGQNIGRPSASSDTFLALFNSKLCIEEYVYYGMSVRRAVFNFAHIFSSMLIVGTENNTMMKLTVTQPVTIKVDDTDTALTSGRQYSFMINRLQTVYVRSLEDLTGTKIVTNKPVSVFSGHQCANIPFNVQECGHAVEQIPPTALWGRVFYTAPFDADYTIRVLAAHDSTNADIYCNGARKSYTINEGEFISESSEEYCVIRSSREVLTVQFNHKRLGNGDPMMTLVPATIHYSNEFNFSTVRGSGYRHLVNIIVLAQYYKPDMIYLISGGVNKSLDTQEWVPVKVNNVIEAYATTVTISEGVAEIIHTNTLALMITTVYGFGNAEGYGHPGGLTLPKGCICSIPNLTTHPSSHAIRLSTNNHYFSLTCEADEATSYNWDRQNCSIPSGAIGVNTNTLTIINLQPEDAGNYRCVATNDCGSSASDYATITIEGIQSTPILSMHPSSSSVVISNGCMISTFTCEADGATSYNWERQNGSIPSGAIGVNTNTLTIINLQPEDAGNYRCVVSTGDRSSTSNYATLSITVGLPGIVLEPIPTSVDLTQTATFTCSATGYYVSYEWTIGSGSFPSKVTGINTNALVIPDVRSSDDNTYTCVASNEGGSVSSNGAKLTVTGLPEVTVTPSSQSVDAADTTTFYAVVRGVGSDMFTYQWRQGRRSIPGADGPILTISNVQRRDAGSYRCVIENKFGDMVLSNRVRLSIANCSPLDDPENGRVFVFPDCNSAVYTCNPGYTISGTAFVECNSGRWSGRPATCNLP